MKVVRYQERGPSVSAKSRPRGTHRMMRELRNPGDRVEPLVTTLGEENFRPCDSKTHNLVPGCGPRPSRSSVDKLLSLSSRFYVPFTLDNDVRNVAITLPSSYYRD
jgi:hypothetical protein